VILEEPQIILIGAAALDYLIGDPWNWIHPVQVMGWLISQYTRLAFRLVKQSIGLRVLGVGIAIALILGSGIVGWVIVELARAIHPILASAIASILLASCFAGRSLRKAAEDITHLLAEKKLEEARSRLSLYVGRDTEDLSESEILRAVLETVTENAVDGVMSPLFYAIVGMFIPVGSVAFALAYKASSTLDSMIGYREAPYTEIGWFSAKTDDVLTWLPCRLTVFTLGVMSGRPFEVWKLCQRDAPNDPSPNSGWSECVYAAVLGVQVGGVNRYKGVEKQKPLLGEPSQPITIERIQHALNLTRWCFLAWSAIAIGVMIETNHLTNLS
jgi:adenosylcobinamide-phosphate synthase